MIKFLTDNSSEMRLARTIVQGIIGVLIANVDGLIDLLTIEPTIKPIIAALVMAVLSPIMSELGKRAER